MTMTVRQILLSFAKNGTQGNISTDIVFNVCVRCLHVVSSHLGKCRGSRATSERLGSSVVSSPALESRDLLVAFQYI